MKRHPQWLVDEMLGRLARYLRFFGHDTEYVQGMSDSEILVRARTEGRMLVTRDRDLAHRFPSAILIRDVALPDQIRQVHHAFPTLHWSLCFDRCTQCNGLLRRATEREIGEGTETHRHLAFPPSSVRRVVWVCERCHHLYWEGTHTQRIRSNIDRWLSSPS